MTPDDQGPTPASFDLPAGKKAEMATPQTLAPDLLTATALFWRARYLRPSGMLPHLPLLFWLVDVLRPRQVVSRGLGDGVAYFAACQAIDRLGSGGACTAIVTGGPGTALIGADLADHNDRNYHDLSRLVTAGSEPAAALFADGSVDLLLIDQAGALSLTDSLPREWQDKLSARAVIVLCGTGQNARQDLFEGRPRISFAEGAGLVMILQGTDCDSRLEKLAEAGSYQTEMRAALHRLGEAHQFEWHHRVARDEISAARKAQADAESRQVNLEATHAMLTRAYAERSNVIARLQSDIFDVKTAQGERAELQRRLDIAQVEQDRLKAELDIRFREIAALTQFLEARARGYQGRIAKVTDGIRATEVAPLAHRLHEAEAGVEAILNSTSWRLTAPFRAIVLALRRR